MYVFEYISENKSYNPGQEWKRLATDHRNGDVFIQFYYFPVLLKSFEC